MPNYSETIIKIFVPDEVAHRIPDVVAALAAADVDVKQGLEDDESLQWIDFERLLPVPKGVLEVENEHQSAASDVVNGNWPRTGQLPEGREMPRSQEEREKLFRETKPEAVPTYEQMLRNIRETGVGTAYNWQSVKWGTKWNTDVSRAPTINEEVDDFYEMDDVTMIHYQITTAWSEPSGYLAALMRACDRNGFGLRCWVSHEDGGSSFNPATEEYQHEWTHLEEYDLDPRPMTSSDRLMFEANGPSFGPDEQSTMPVDETNPHMIMIKGLEA